MKFEVTPGELEGLAHGLSGLLGELEHAGDVRSISPGAAENAELQAAIESFVVQWAGDLQALQAKLLDLTRRLDGAGVEYDHVERVVEHKVEI